ncbi:MFS transporter [Nocardia sp. CA-135953]|uniref:MFS transporter n=1 Tax=Nocardia sp. CA-135953 TaxID=3239978 RepID=UPI003D955F03
MCSVATVSAPRSRNAGRLAVGVASLVVVIIPSYLTGTLAISMGAELGFTPALLGVLMAMRFAAAAASSAAAGRWVQKFGATGGMRVAVLTVAGTSIVIGLFVRNPIVFAALFCLNGAALAIVQPAVDIWVARSVPVRQQGLAFGVKQAAVPTAALVAGVAVPAAAAGAGWRVVWLAAAAAALLTAALVPWRGGRATETPSDSVGVKRERRSVADLAVLAVCFGFGSTAVVNLTTFLVVSTVSAGFDEGTAGAVFAASSTTGIAARLTLGYWADRIKGDLLVVLAGVLTAGAGAFMLLGLTAGTSYVVAAPIAFAFGLGWPGLLLLVVVRENQQAPGVATGFVNTGSYVGSIVGPAVFGLLTTRLGYSAGWLFTACCLLASAAAALVARAMLRRRSSLVAS